MTQLNTIKQLIIEDKVEEAENALFLSLYSDEGIDNWANALVETNATDKIPHILGFASKIAFDRKAKTAFVDLRSKVITLGTEFFLQQVETWGDVIFLLLHERNHVLIEFFYGSRMKEFRSFRFGNLWEDLFINNTILMNVRSTLCKRFYVIPDENYFHLLLNQEQIDEWFTWFEYKHKKAVQGCKVLSRYIEHLARGNLEPHDIPYYEWMEIGLTVERTLQPETEYTDLAGDLPEEGESENEEESEEYKSGSDSDDDDDDDSEDNYEGVSLPPPSHIKKIRVGTEQLPDHIKELLTLQLSTDAYNHHRSINFEKYRQVLSAQVVAPLLASRIVDDDYKVLSPFPSTISRRDVFSLAQGLIPSYWEQNRQKPLEEKTVALYVDTSGSMTSWYPLIPQIVKEMNGFCFPVYNFDTEVMRVEDPLDSVVYYTNQGTSYGCVAQHILDSDVKSVIVFSDSTTTLAKDLHKNLLDFLTEFIYITIAPEKQRCGFSELVKALGARGKIVSLAAPEPKRYTDA